MSEETPEQISQRIETESALAQSAEYKAELEKANETILPEGLHPPAPVAPETAIVKPAAIPEKAIDPGAEFSSKSGCPHCGQSGWKSERALAAHVRFKHELPAQRAEERAEAAKPPEKQPELQPPDFSDITGEQLQPRFDINGAPPLSTVPKVNYEATAIMAFDISTGALSRLFGPEWQATSPEERAGMVEAIKKYFESIEMPDIPPGYMLCIMCAIYAAPRLQAQPTRTKLVAMWLWVKSKFKRKQKFAPVIIKTETK